MTFSGFILGMYSKGNTCVKHFFLIEVTDLDGNCMYCATVRKFSCIKNHIHIPIYIYIYIYLSVANFCSINHENMSWGEGLLF